MENSIKEISNFLKPSTTYLMPCGNLFESDYISTRSMLFKITSKCDELLETCSIGNLDDWLINDSGLKKCGNSVYQLTVNKLSDYILYRTVNKRPLTIKAGDKFLFPEFKPFIKTIYEFDKNPWNKSIIDGFCTYDGSYSLHRAFKSYSNCINYIILQPEI
jgi:hypothetical protein